jgi:hypothetical protein
MPQDLLKFWFSLTKRDALSTMHPMRFYLFLLAFLASACETPVNQSIDLGAESAAFYLSGTYPASPAAAIETLRRTPVLRDPILSADLSKQYHWLEKEAEHGEWVLGESPTPQEIFCFQKADCILDRVLAWRSSGAIAIATTISIYQMLITNPRGYVRARAGDQPRSFHYHQVTLFKSSDGKLSVFDPILMPDAGLHPLSDLLNRLEEPASLQYSIVRR